MQLLQLLLFIAYVPAVPWYSYYSITPWGPKVYEEETHYAPKSMDITYAELLGALGICCWLLYDISDCCDLGPV